MLSSIFGCGCGATSTSKKVQLDKQPKDPTADKTNARISLLSEMTKGQVKDPLQTRIVTTAASAQQPTSSTASAISSSSSAASTTSTVAKAALPAKESPKERIVMAAASAQQPTSSTASAISSPNSVTTSALPPCANFLFHSPSNVEIPQQLVLAKKDILYGDNGVLKKSYEEGDKAFIASNPARTFYTVTRITSTGDSTLIPVKSDHQHYEAVAKIYDAAKASARKA